MSYVTQSLSLYVRLLLMLIVLLVLPRSSLAQDFRQPR